MLYILGVDAHRYQAVNPAINPDEPKFHDYILRFVKDRAIGHLAEEMNDELLRRENNAHESVCRKVAKILGITLSMCEPTSQEKQAIGYIDKSWEEFVREDDTGCNDKINAAYSSFHRKQWPLRENFWFEKLKPHLRDNILFICGAQHADRFSKLLQDKGIKNQVICMRWKP
ncbi:MAG: hypothetical protein ACREQA_24490 [Candidatus Binatia bacterium]